MVIRIELGDVGGHAHGGKSHHHSGEINKNTCQAILFGSKRLFLRKEISIDKADTKPNINDQRRMNALLANGAHAIKIVNGEWSVVSGVNVTRSLLSLS